MASEVDRSLQQAKKLLEDHSNLTERLSHKRRTGAMTFAQVNEVLLEDQNKLATELRPLLPDMRRIAASVRAGKTHWTDYDAAMAKLAIKAYSNLTLVEESRQEDSDSDSEEDTDML